MSVLSAPATSLCLLRLSAVGDICHSLPVLRSIQAAWPQCKISWIIGRNEYQLVKTIPDVEFIVFDKSAGFDAYWQLWQALRKRRFDVLLHMQMSLRASLASLCVPAKIKLGFDRERAKDGQWLFSNAKIAASGKQHVIDSFLEFVKAIGIDSPRIAWDLPVSDEAQQAVDGLLGDLDARAIAVISPCSAMAYRNWNASGYAQICDALVERGFAPVLSGGPSAIEHQYGCDIEAQAKHKPLNLIGKTSLPELLALLAKARLVISPDSGPAHIATALNTPVVGLYACTNPDRARPYLSAKYVVNRYPEAVRDKYAKEVDQLPWGIRVRDPGTMDRISVEDVLEKLDLLIGDLGKR